MAFIGLDGHKKHIEVVYVDSASSKVKRSFRLKTDVHTLKGFAASLSSKDIVALESTTHAFPIANILRSNGAKVVISNPMKTKIIAESKVKTDKIDAEALARLLASDYLPTIWEPDSSIQEIRKLCSYANAIGKKKTMTKNRIHSILHRNLVDYSDDYTDLFGKKGREFLKTVSLPEDERFQLDQELEILDFLEKKIAVVHKRIASKAYHDEDVLRLMTISGIDYYTALSIKAAIGDIRRFSSPKKLVSYIGLNPRIYQSGNSCYGGPITKRGRSHARWVLIQAAQSIVKSPGPMRGFFLRLLRRKERNKAIVAVAAKLTRIIWHMLTEKENYHYAPPLRTKEKLSKLRIIATGVRLQGGTKKGVPSKGGRKAYLLARKNDHANATIEEQKYTDFIKTRKSSPKTTSSINKGE